MCPRLVAWQPRRRCWPRASLRHAWPAFLPDGDHFLFLALSTEPAQSAIYQGTPHTTEVRRVQPGESRIGVTASHLVSLT